YPGIAIDYDWELTPNEWVDKIGVQHYNALVRNNWLVEVIETPKHQKYFIGYDTQLYTREDLNNYLASRHTWDDWHKQRYG
ncbi:hypothetical protein, partial [Streptococcus pneumoniae]|uniref:hypothetical protein n=1 Tax=Streptococcus pneumoniae TaxID=1313 RepID=UPI001E2B5F17